MGKGHIQKQIKHRYKTTYKLQNNLGAHVPGFYRCVMTWKDYFNPAIPSRGLSGMQMNLSCSEILKDVPCERQGAPLERYMIQLVSCVCLCIFGGVCMCVWRSEDNFRCHPSGAVHLWCETAPLIGMER